VFRRSESSTGHVSYKRPGKMRFDYKTPTKKSFLVDGKALWIIQPADNQALVDKCFKSDALTSSLTFLFGEGKLAEQFDIKPGKSAPEGLKRMVMDPKQPQGAYARLLLDVDPAVARVVASTVVDHQGNTNRFVFKQAVYDGKLPAKRFVYKPPKNITVMPIPGSCNK
jgi:outer membrane lipoprotein carrier protein